MCVYVFVCVCACNPLDRPVNLVNWIKLLIYVFSVKNSIYFKGIKQNIKWKKHEKYRSKFDKLAKDH